MAAPAQTLPIIAANITKALGRACSSRGCVSCETPAEASGCARMPLAGRSSALIQLSAACNQAYIVSRSRQEVGLTPAVTLSAATL